MNKLSKLVAQKIGKDTTYDEVSRATYGTQGQCENEDTALLGGMLRSSSSSVITEERKSFLQYLRENMASITIVILLVIIFALAGQRASALQQVANLVEDKTSASAIKWRPCQIYVDPASDNEVRILQTSLGDPSNQWGQIPCLVRNTKYTSNSRAHEDSQWSWLFGTDSDESKRPLEYGAPSAVIRTNFEKLAHPNREPILGFGGAFTEASSLNFMSLDNDGRSAVMELLFGKEGLGYSLGRVPINSCDFSVASYSFDDVADDFDLENFDMKVTHDVMSGMIEMLLKADDTLKSSWPGDSLNILASPWSPPAWMKKPTAADPLGYIHAKDMTGSAEPNCLRDGTGPSSRYAKAWALYFSKFISAYKTWGIDIFAVTVQNEPEFPAPWEACAYSPSIEADFIANHLGPTLQREHPKVKLFIFDHNKDHIVNWGETILDEENPASKFVNGTAVHWYAGGMDRLLDGAVGQPNMHRFISMLKYQNVSDDHLLLGSEACHCPSTGYAGGDLKVAWARAERYAHTILADLAAGSNGWVEWNLILDPIGGPNHLGNMCDAPLLAVPYRTSNEHNVSQLPDFEHENYPFGPVVGDARTKEELNSMGMPAQYLDRGVVVQPMFYYMGHISRHVRPGSKAVHAIVDQADSGPNSRAFRIETNDGSFVAGGGINDLAREGIEVTLWPCDGSTRQEWLFNDLGQLQVFGHDWKGKPTTSCIGNKPDTSFEGLTLTGCDNNAAIFQLNTLNETSSAFNLLLENTDAVEGENCVVVQPLKSNGGAYGPRGGAQVTIGKCDQESAIWQLDKVSGEVISSFFDSDGGDTCLTTGWPFLQVGAYIDREKKKRTIIVLNEASDPANYVIRSEDNNEILLTNSTDRKSVV